MKKLSLILVVLSLALVSFAENGDDKNNKNTKSESSTTTQGSISGKVIDQTTGEALAGVKVVLAGTQMVAYTDFDGNFVFQSVQNGKYSLEVNFISYKQSVHQNVTTELENPLEIKMLGL